jgi:hypothetical protein
MNSAVENSQIKKLLARMLGGLLVGGAVTGLAIFLLKPVVDLDDPSRMVAVVAGLIYALMGLIVGLGSLAPGLGANFLNVENAEEIVEERHSFGPSAIVCLLIGVFFFALALGPTANSAGFLSSEAAATIAGVSFFVLTAISIWMARRMDELNRALGVESSALAMNVSILLFGGWAALAQLGYVDWIAPLVLLSGLALVQLATIFWVVGKRGMLMPR